MTYNQKYDTVYSSQGNIIHRQLKTFTRNWFNNYIHLTLELIEGTIRIRTNVLKFKAIYKCMRTKKKPLADKSAGNT